MKTGTLPSKKQDKYAFFTKYIKSFYKLRAISGNETGYLAMLIYKSRKKCVKKCGKKC